MVNILFPAKGRVIRPKFSCNLSRNNVALQVVIVCCPYYHLRATNFRVAKGRKSVYFLQQENLLRAEVVI